MPTARQIGSPWVVVSDPRPFDAASRLTGGGQARYYAMTTHVIGLTELFALLEPTMVDQELVSKPDSRLLRHLKHYRRVFEREPRAWGYALAWLGSIIVLRSGSGIIYDRPRPLIRRHDHEVAIADLVRRDAVYSPIDNEIANAIGWRRALGPKMHFSGWIDGGERWEHEDVLVRARRELDEKKITTNSKRKS